MRQSSIHILAGLALVCSVGFAGWASAASLAMNRNTEADMASYRAYECMTGPTCVPNVRNPALDIAHPATGNPTIVIPVTESGRICYRAVDTVGNESVGCSNVIPFRGQPLNAPTGLQQNP